MKLSQPDVDIQTDPPIKAKSGAMSMVKSKKRFLATVTQCNSKKKKRIETKEISAIPAKSSFPCIPNELILYDVLTRLPIKSLRRFSCVSQRWCETLSGGDAVFNASHLIHSKRRNPLILSILHEEEEEETGDVDIPHKKHKVSGGSSFNFDVLHSNLYEASHYFSYRTIKRGRSYFLGYCNGLVCIRSRSGFEICNLSTHEVLLLPQPPPLGRIRPHHINYGFGFDPVNNVYKVVQIVDGWRCMVFSLGGTNSWRDITNTLPSDITSNFDLYSRTKGGYLSDRALYSNTSLYWLYTPDDKIVSFHIQSEKFLLLPCPYYYPTSNAHFLFELKGCPCVGYQRLLSSVTLGGYILITFFWLVNDPHCFPLILNWETHTIEIPYLFHETASFTSCLGRVIAYWIDDRDPNMHMLISYDIGAQEVAGVRVPLHSRCLLRQVGFIYHIENLHSLKTLVQGASAGQMRYLPKPKQSTKKPSLRYGS